VVGDDLDVIGSGPTVADSSTYDDALRILERLGVTAACPPNTIDRLKRGAAGLEPETPKRGDPRLARATATVIGGRHQAMRGAADEAAKRGYHVVVIEEPVVGQARDAATRYADLLAQRRGTLEKPVAVVSSGETTVLVKGTGRGGRNQEFALALLDRVRSLGTAVTVASLGTDGIDGPTDAAGAIVDSDSAARAARAGMTHARSFLDDNNSYAFFDAIGDLLKPGATGTNVGDLQIALIA
jgi:hydroxypyruvate reductase